MRYLKQHIYHFPRHEAGIVAYVLMPVPINRLGLRGHHGLHY